MQADCLKKLSFRIPSPPVRWIISEKMLSMISSISPIRVNGSALKPGRSLSIQESNWKLSMKTRAVIRKFLI